MTEIKTPLGYSYPTLWMELATERHSTSRVVTDASGLSMAVVHGPRARLRQAQLVLLYNDEDEARIAEDMHAYGGIMRIEDPERPTHNMDYVVTGSITRELDPETRKVWILTIDVTEVTE